jgi:hypothetical protein
MCAWSRAQGKREKSDYLTEGVLPLLQSRDQIK